MCLMTPEFDRRARVFAGQVDALVWAVTELCFSQTTARRLLIFIGGWRKRGNRGGSSFSRSREKVARRSRVG